MKRYCPSCGAGTDYSGVRPTSCSRCKKSYEGAIQVPPAVATAPRRLAPRQSESNTEGFDEDAPRETEFDPNEGTEGLGIQIVAHPNARRRVTLEDILLQKPGEAIREVPKVVNRDALLDEMLPARHLSALTPRAPAPPSSKSAKKAPVARRKKR